MPVNGHWMWNVSCPRPPCVDHRQTDRRRLVFEAHSSSIIIMSPPQPAHRLMLTAQTRMRATMQCSWKSMVLLALASIAIQYTAIRTFSTKPLSLLCSVGLATTGHTVNCSLRDLTRLGQATLEDSDPGCDGILPHAPSAPSVSLPSSKANKRINILILATTRSGSSFVGQLFNQHPEVFYLFEPLYHVQLALLPRLAQSRNLAERRVMLGAARDLLRSLYHCHLNSLESYIRPRPANHSTDKLFRRGASRSLCSPPVCEAPLGPEGQNLVLADEGECVRRCGPLNVSLAADACRTKRHAAIKTKTRELYSFLGLVLDHNVEDWIINNTRGSSDLSSRQKFTTVRDSAANAENWRKTRELYSFLGLVLDHNVEDWIINNTRGSSDLSSRQKFTTVRDSAANAENWRVKLSFDMVVYTQTVCQPLLDLLGYKTVFHSRELRNLSHSLVEDRTFHPFF
ncbi:Carbohydrate sulfotransferase 1 [Collichthys lucidus]|uniref:Carbohydrate sulfotransferase 1 n=1 Tax=Collichthys lucidus TaxID=240159 RepID=A0A4V6ARL7_COLLU|nr:Carbohydrate sulfotransferase 1 [Collichthys lucidus]